jgi:hypothetical protein
MSISFVLVRFSTSLSIDEDPMGWLDASKTHVFDALSLVREDVSKFRRIPVAHLVSPVI